MVHRNKITIALILSSIGLHTTATRSEENPYVIGGLLVGGAAVATLGIGAYLGWFDESNQSIIEEAHKTLIHTQKQYGSCATYLISEGILRTNISYIKNYYPATEEQLYHIADYLTVSNQHGRFSDYLYNLNGQIGRLSSQTNKITKRIKTIENRNYQDQQAYNELIAFKELAEQIRVELPIYEQLHVFFKSHQSYFALFEREVEIRKEYINEIGIITNYHTDISTCSAMLKVQATSGHHGRYPLTTYVQRLNNAISRLNSQLAVTTGYPKRISWCIDLKNQLTFAKGVISADPAYTAEVIAYEKEKIEREKIELAHKEIALQKARVSALKEKNEIEREKARIEAEKIRLEKQKHSNSSLGADVYVTLKI